MIHGRCVDYRVSPDEPDPKTVVSETFEDEAVARGWLNTMADQFLWLDEELGRCVTITDQAGTVIDQIDMPPHDPN